MQKILLIIATIFTIGCKDNSKNNSLKGDWKFQYINDSAVKTTEEMAAIFWLNQMTEGTTVTFTNDSFFVNHNFYGLYNSDKIQIKVPNNETKYLTYTLKKDTLILTPNNEKAVSLKFTKL